MQFETQRTEYRRHHPRASYEVVLIDGRLAGRLYVRRSDEAVHVMDIALLPEFRGRGVGTGLIEELLDEAARDGKLASIYVEKENPALALYERLGFRPAGEHGVYLLMRREAPGQAKTA